MLGDELFDILPAHLSLQDAPQGLAATDLARLLWCRHFLNEGYERVVWADADILVLYPALFEIPDLPYALCRELWTGTEGENVVRSAWAVNNCFMLFARGNPFLDQYIAASIEAGSGRSEELARAALGPNLLGRINEQQPLPQIITVPTLSPLMIWAVYNRHEELLRVFRDQWQAPMHAAHLCRSLGSEGGAGFIAPEWHEEVVSSLAADPRILTG